MGRAPLFRHPGALTLSESDKFDGMSQQNEFFAADGPTKTSVGPEDAKGTMYLGSVSQGSSSRDTPTPASLTSPSSSPPTPPRYRGVNWLACCSAPLYKKAIPRRWQLETFAVHLLPGATSTGSSICTSQELVSRGWCLDSWCTSKRMCSAAPPVHTHAGRTFRRV